MIMYKNRIFIFGGNLVDTTSVPLWCFDLLTSEWVSLCSRGPLYSVSDHVVDSKSTASTTPLSHSQVPSNLTQHSAVLYNQAIFIFGGYRHVYGVSGRVSLSAVILLLNSFFPKFQSVFGNNAKGFIVCQSCIYCCPCDHQFYDCSMSFSLKINKDSKFSSNVYFKWQQGSMALCSNNSQ